MSKEKNQENKEKSQPNQNQKQNIHESIKGSGDAGGLERSRSGNAGDTKSTGPRHNDED